MERTISRPSAAVVTLQALVRRYFAISARVSRSSSTTSMFGGDRTMQTFVDDSPFVGKDFCFQMFLARGLQLPATCKKGSLRWLIQGRSVPFVSTGAAMTTIS